MRADLVQPPPGVEEAQAAARRDVQQALRDAAQARADAEVAREEARQAQVNGGVIVGPEVGGRRGGMSITRNGDGHTIVHTPNGQIITIDPAAVPSLQGQQALIEHAITSMPPAGHEEQGPPQSVIVLTGLVLFFLTLMVIGWPIARAIARRMDRKGAGSATPDSEARLARIENAVEAIAVEVERVSEGQRFATRLLAERAEADGVSARAREAMHAR
jgi:hypothetical protein